MMIITTVLTKTIWIYGTANIGRSGIVTTTKIANHIANALNILFFWIADCPFIEGAIGVGFDNCSPPTMDMHSLSIV